MEPPQDVIDERKQEDRENNLDRRRLSQPSIDKLRKDIGNIDDPDAKAALEDVFEILTGQNP